ncbi:MAG: hypothetical protein RR365_03120 [Bacteroides sp.]
MNRWLLLSLLSLWAGGCSPTKTIQTPWYLDMPALKVQYNAAVADASIAQADEICRTLPAITSPGEDERLEWVTEKQKQLLLVASVMTATDAKAWHSDQSFNLSAEQGETAMPWVTLPYDLKRHVSSFHCTDSLELRMRMVLLLGLPPDYNSDYIVFFYADREGIFRPSPDRETDDHEASLDFPPGTPQHYRAWFNEYSQFAYQSATPYPWTRLGYTYDWNADNKSHIGPGEFVINTGSLVRIKAKLTVWQWYQQLKTT